MERQKKSREKINKNTVPEDFTMGLALYDAVPVVFFGISVILFGIMLGSIVFLIGGVLCFWAGIAKVIWKLIVVKKRKNIWWLFMQMRIFMPIGFLIMIIATVLSKSSENFADILRFSGTFPVSFLLIIGVLGFVLMGILGIALDSADRKANLTEQTVNTIAQFAIAHAVILLFLSVGYYKADDTARDALNSSDTVITTVTDGAIVFTPKNTVTDAGLIFYPGGKVEYTAYAPLMQEIAKQGITCVLVEMPLNYAFFDYRKADEVMLSHPEIEKWFLAGHSLGGAFGSMYASKRTDRLCGVILLGAYSTKSLRDMPVLSIYGTNDGVMRRNKYEKYKANLPEDVIEFLIEGGNHAMFGSYGPQSGDGEGNISPKEQRSITAETIVNFVLSKAQ